MSPIHIELEVSTHQRGWQHSFKLFRLSIGEPPQQSTSRPTHGSILWEESGSSCCPRWHGRPGLIPSLTRSGLHVGDTLRRSRLVWKWFPLVQRVFSFFLPKNTVGCSHYFHAWYVYLCRALHEYLYLHSQDPMTLSNFSWRPSWWSYADGSNVNALINIGEGERRWLVVCWIKPSGERKGPNMSSSNGLSQEHPNYMSRWAREGGPHRQEGSHAYGYGSHGVSIFIG